MSGDQNYNKQQQPRYQRGAPYSAPMQQSATMARPPVPYASAPMTNANPIVTQGMNHPMMYAQPFYGPGPGVPPAGGRGHQPATGSSSKPTGPRPSVEKEEVKKLKERILQKRKQQQQQGAVSSTSSTVATPTTSEGSTSHWDSTSSSDINVSTAVASDSSSNVTSASISASGPSAAVSGSSGQTASHVTSSSTNNAVAIGDQVDTGEGINKSSEQMSTTASSEQENAGGPSEQTSTIGSTTSSFRPFKKHGPEEGTNDEDPMQEDTAANQTAEHEDNADKSNLKFGCTDSLPVEYVTNEHDGTGSTIEYKVDTLLKLKPSNVEDHRPDALLVDFTLVKQDSGDNAPGGSTPRGRDAPHSNKGFGGKGNKRGGGGGGPFPKQQEGWRHHENKKRDPYEQLGRAGKAFTKRQKDTSEVGIAKKTITDVCNKLSRDNFDRLSEELVNMHIPSFEVLLTVMNLIFDKALEFQTFQDLFADLCRRLTKKTDVWSENFTLIKQDDEGQWWYDLSGSKNDPDKEPEWNGPFPSEADAKSKARNRSMFKRILLNRCQEEFEREGAYNEIEQERQQKEKELEEARKNSPSGGAPADMVKEKEKLEVEWAEKETKIKKRMLANIGFIGHLYMSGLLTDLIVSECIRKLLRNKNLAQLDEENIEALLKLLLLVGKKYESKVKESANSKIIKMERVMEEVNELSKDKRLSSRLRFRCLDVIEARHNGWKMPEHHVAAAAKTMSKKDFRKQAQQEDLKRNQEVEGLRSKYAHDSSYKRSSAKPRNDSRNETKLGPSRHENRGKAPTGGSSMGQGLFQPRTGLMRRNKTTDSSAATQPVPREQKNQEKMNNEQPPPMSEEEVNRLKQRVHNSLKEYAELQDNEELKSGIEEVSNASGGAPLLVVVPIEMLRTSRSQKERGFAQKGLMSLVDSGLVSEEDAKKGLEMYLPEFSKDLEDAPHLDTYIAELLSALVKSGKVSVVSIAQVCGTEGGFKNGVACRLVAALVCYASRQEDGSPDVSKMKDYLGSLRKEHVGLADLYGPGALKKTVNRLGELHIDDSVSDDMRIFNVANEVKSKKYDISTVPADMMNNSVFIRVLLSELINDAGDMGMGPEDGSEDLQWLQGHTATLETLFRSCGADNVPYLIETVLQTIHANSHGMYEEDWLPQLDKAYIKWLVDHSIVTNEQLRHWKTFQPRPPFGWAHSFAAANV